MIFFLSIFLVFGKLIDFAMLNQLNNKCHCRRCFSVLNFVIPKVKRCIFTREMQFKSRVILICVCHQVETACSDNPFKLWLYPFHTMWAHGRSVSVIDVTAINRKSIHSCETTIITAKRERKVSQRKRNYQIWSVNLMTIESNCMLPKVCNNCCVLVTQLLLTKTRPISS